MFLSEIFEPLQVSNLVGVFPQKYQQFTKVDGKSVIFWGFNQGTRGKLIDEKSIGTSKKYRDLINYQIAVS
jgi:hypothetical protein